ncbi:MAG: thiamine diphosphokinase [Erysipelotrichia bacterium]|nr:thiamine diphosphokinase [Erysipelotrichia bacterium]NCC53868.1 thiamine diphosphokinase [Erysipelotrichia bacterium]
MSKVVLVANRTINLVKEDHVDYIGVDKGSLYCLQHGITMRCAIGDFDSISKDEYAMLKKACTLIELPAEKDEVDSEYALHYAKQLGYDEIELQGVMGGRQDHFLAIFQLLKTGNIAFVMRDEYNIIYRLEAGEHLISKQMQYLSIFACEKIRITITNVKYPLHERVIDESDVYLVSNEIINEQAKIKISGRVIIVQSKSLE